VRRKIGNSYRDRRSKIIITK